tara:strand:- start:21 stop:896 length:876 start_codon:yes stop_codon:yes gene_type:complete
MNKLREASKKRKDYNEYLTNEFLIETALGELSITGDGKDFIVGLVKDLNHALATEIDIKQSYITKFMELKEENERIKRCFDSEHDKRMKNQEKWRESCKENKKLKETIQEMHKGGDIVKKIYGDNLAIGLKNKVEELGKRNCILQEQMDREHIRYMDEVSNRSDDKCEIAKALGIEWNGEIKDIMTSITSLKKTNKQKTRIIRNLREDMGLWKASYDDDIREARQEGIDELKEENKKLEAWKYEVIQTAKAMDWDLPEEEDEYSHIECGDCKVCGCYHSEYDPCGTQCARD